MVNEGGETLWDFVSLVAWWNLYGLPVLLVVVAIQLSCGAGPAPQ